MFSYEIEQLLKLRNYLVSIEEYNQIISSSSQIDHVKYEDNVFKVWTTDNYTFTFKINFK